MKEKEEKKNNEGNNVLICLSIQSIHHSANDMKMM